MRHVAAAAIVVLALLPSVWAQPQVSNGNVRQTPVSGRLTPASVAALAPKGGVAWVGYAVPVIDGDHRMCCFSSDTAACCRGCALEPGQRSGNTVSSTGGAKVVALEAGRLLHVLLRVESGAVERIRVFSEDCALDAGGLTVHWLTGVAPADSVSLLAAFLSGTATRRLADNALTALAMHREPAALDRLLSAARDGTTSHLRGQALFWLAQRAGERAVGAITDAIARDPETDVKRRAVFALSQLPRDEGVPLLIDVARTNSNPAVRKQAMFWLGQSRDPRAIKFFEEILFKQR
jgi:hypothetical protein